MTPFAESEFRKATRSEPNRTCVCVARRDGLVEVRDDKVAFGSPADARLVFTEAQFDTVLEGVRTGVYDGLPLTMTRQSDGSYVFTSCLEVNAGITLTFSEAEFVAFIDGVTNREFDAAAFALA